AGPGVRIDLVDSDGFSGTDGETILITATGGGSPDDTQIASVGLGESLVADIPKTGNTLRVKSIAAGNGIALSTAGDVITITSSAAQGPAGANGATWFVSNTVPSNAIGTNSDLHLNTTNGDVSLKANGSWVVQMNIRGPQGAQGVQGLQGA